MNTLRFPEDSLERMRATLLAEAPNEAAAVVLAHRAETTLGHVLLVRDVVHVPKEFAKCEPLRIEIAPEFIARMLKRARLEDLCLFFAHSHPFTPRAQFSAQDDAGERALLPTLFQRAERGPHGAILISTDDVAARLYEAPDDEPIDIRTVQVGRTLTHWPADPHGLLPSEYDRTVRALGPQAQRRLADLRVGIVGLGGMGSLVVQQLAHLGVEHFVLLDPDVVETTNLNRVVGAANASVGRPKVDVALDLVTTIRPNAFVEAITGDVCDGSIARRLIHLDAIFCCTDSHGSRSVLNQIAYQFFVPVIDIGVRIDASNGSVTSIVGRVQELAPGLPCLVCESLLDPEEVRRDLLSDEERRRDPYIVGAHEPQPAVISINAVSASLAVTMLLGICCGLPLDTRHQLYFGDRGTVRNVTATSAPSCYVCSRTGAYGTGDARSMPGRRR